MKGLSARCSSFSPLAERARISPLIFPSTMLHACFNDIFSLRLPKKNYFLQLFSERISYCDTFRDARSHFLQPEKGPRSTVTPFGWGTGALLAGRRPLRAAIASTKELACQTRLLHLHHGAPARPEAFSWEENLCLTAAQTSISVSPRTDGQGCCLPAAAREKDSSSPTASKV